MMNPKGAGKWRANAPIRTNTGTSIRGKTISHPIPFPDDDEFPIRTPGTGIALPLGPEALEREIRLRTSIATEELHPSQPTGGAESEQAMAQTTTFSADQPEARKARLPTTMRNSVAGSVPSSGDRPEKKKSSLKSVLGRLFGKKRKSSSSSVSKPNPDSLRAGQHRSDPTALTRHPQEGSASKRSASLPINEFNRALRSHSVVAEDIPQSIRNSLNRDSVQSNPQRRSRRATTPSRLWTPNKTPGYVDWTGLSPRPASTHARGSTVISDAEANAIGTAVTSGSHPNRRSRSLGEIRDTALQITIARRRSDEIKYWRESYDPTILSPMSSNKAEADEPILVDEEDARDALPREPPQPFNFGPLGALTGMKITEVASLETRVQRLEDRMLQMERIISRSFENPHSESTLPMQEPPQRRSPGRVRGTSIPRPKTNNSDTSLPRTARYREQQEQHLHEPMPQMRSSSYGSSRRPSIPNSMHHSYQAGFDTGAATQVPSEAPPNFSQSTARPLSTSTTIRGLPSSPSTSRDGTLNTEHYTTLTNMILAEQAARQELESVVLGLQEQVRKLTQSPRISSMNSKLDPTTAFSTFEHDDSSDDGRYVGENDVFQTPNEDIGSHGQFGDEIFGDVLRNSASDEITGKGAPRTLSLSQITLGTGKGHAARNF